MTDKPADPVAASPVFAVRTGPASAVGRAESPLSFLPGLGLALVVGVGVFMSLAHGRAAHAQMAHQPPSRQGPPTPPSQMTPPTPTAPTAPPPSLPIPAPTGLPASSPDDLAHLQAPAMVVDLAEPQAAVGSASATAATMAGAAPAAGAGDPKASADEKFALRVAGAGVETARATRLRDLALVAPQGTVIPAYLQTAINSDLPGFVRATVSQDVRGFDGSTVLIPRGSTLIGQYSSGVAAGQTRAFVVWSRVLTPDGVSVEIGSPTTDPLGRGGLPGETNSHFLRRFGASMLLSVVSAGAEALANRGHGGDNTAIVIGSPQQASNIASIALQREVDIPTTIEVKPGAPLRVFVARDLDFSTVMSRRR